MPAVVVTEFMSEEGAQTLVDEFGALYDPTLVEDRARLLDVVADAIALVVRNRTQVDRELLESAPNLRVVARLGVGLDNFDLEAANDLGIAVEPATGANVTSVTEYVIGAALTLVRGVFSSTDLMTEGRWPRTELRGNEVAGRTLGLIGFGAIAREVARKAIGLEMSVVAHDPFINDDDPAWGSVKPLGVPELLGTADVVSIHVPLTNETRHLIGASEIAAMKKGAIVINTSRGGIVDEDALVAALRANQLGGAALDVFEEEPLTSASASRFAEVPNLILSPHVAGVTNESEARTGDMTVETVRRHLESR